MKTSMQSQDSVQKLSTSTTRISVKWTRPLRTVLTNTTAKVTPPPSAVPSASARPVNSTTKNTWWW